MEELFRLLISFLKEYDRICYFDLLYTYKKVVPCSYTHHAYFKPTNVFLHAFRWADTPQDAGWSLLNTEWYGHLRRNGREYFSGIHAHDNFSYDVLLSMWQNYKTKGGIVSESIF